VGRKKPRGGETPGARPATDSRREKASMEARGRGEAARKARGAGQVVSLRLSPDAVARLDAAAERAGLSRSAYVERLASELPPAIVNA